jgi:hypothetical protein
MSGEPTRTSSLCSPKPVGSPRLSLQDCFLQAKQLKYKVVNVCYLLIQHGKSCDQCQQQPNDDHNNNSKICDAETSHCSHGTVFGRLNATLKQGTWVLELSTHDLPSISLGDNSIGLVFDVYAYMLQSSFMGFADSRDKKPELERSPEGLKEGEKAERTSEDSC